MGSMSIMGYLLALLELGGRGDDPDLGAHARFDALGRWARHRDRGHGLADTGAPAGVRRVRGSAGSYVGAEPCRGPGTGRT
jgi:hypothetical protein